ncbi:hypothetical protein TURU_070095 [Turdus rufiventris]|nr:hypothetical protein TURU_070095 [Turdus rufiventris]
MALVHHLFLSFLILLMVLYPGTANYVPQKSKEAADSLADSLAAWEKDGLEPLGRHAAYVEAKGLRKSSVSKHMRNPVVLPKSEEKQSKKAGESPQTDQKHSEMAGETTKKLPKVQKHIESLLCRGTGCMIGIVIALVVLPTAIVMCFLAICWWCQRKRRLSGDQQERTALMTGTDSQSSLPEPALPLQ